MKMRTSRSLTLLCLLVFALSVAGCALRPTEAAPERALTLTPEPSPSPTDPVGVSFRVEFWNGDEMVDEQELLWGETPLTPSIWAARVVGWTDETGASVDPEAVSVSGDAKYYAQVSPRVNADAVFLFADEQGLLRPEELFTRGDAALAVAALSPEEALSIYPMPEGEAVAEPMLRTEFLALLCALFNEEYASLQMQAVCPYESETITRGIAANVICSLLGPIEVPEGAYYPDVGPYAWGRDAILRAAGASERTSEDFAAMAKDEYLWLDGYLYALDEEGYFITGEYNGLQFDGNGRFTSGDAELDRYVAETLVEYVQPDRPRLEDLRAVYYHVKNDFQYLTRNYYASGETGWENQEALTLFTTGKGNCYCYAGLFRSLARGLGYNAVCYSGTMGNQDQPHAWTEITLEDGSVYICDPEIEMNYWWVAAMKNDASLYTNNFMMPIESSAGWNYQAVGR